MEDVIKLNSVSKTYGKGKRRVEAVKDVSFGVTRGRVFGFLGPNGAGKSSTIRMMMDLVRPSTGELFLLGENVQRNPAVLRRVGALVEGANFYSFLTGRKNLQVLARLSGGDDRRIDKLLAQMSLADRADRPVKGYSTGMKQRLGIAAALLHDPDLVILDEPTNGLDPAGIQEIRHFIRRLVDEMGKTVFLSSHLLGEVEQVCDEVAIIDRGTLLRVGSVRSLLAEQERVRIEVDDAARAAAVLGLDGAVDENGRWLDLSAGRDKTARLVAQLVAAEVAVFQVIAQRQKLEDVFLSLTNKGNVDHEGHED